MAFNLFMHERNIYKERPNFKKIAIDYPEFRKYAVPDEKGRIHIDFNNQDALRMLTKILLKKDFNLDVIIPNGFLIPTVPQRLNYILWIEDLLALLPKQSLPVSGIDIGTGPCAIFSLLGAKTNSWNFVSTETSREAIQWAEKNIKANNLQSHIQVIQVSKDSILKDILLTNGNRYDFCLCNPPFFENIEEIKRRSSRAKETLATTAKKDEILAEGGEVTFVKKLIRDSLIFKDQVSLYTSMFGRKKSFLQILKELQSIEGISYVKTEFCQGNTIRWGIAWTFLNSVDLQKMQLPKAKKPKKAKPPLLHRVPKTYKDFDTIKKLLNMIKSTFLELEILFKVIKCAENYAELQVTAEKNTWSHQRRKRRECMKDKDDPATMNSTNSTTSIINETKVVTTNLETSKPSTHATDLLLIHSSELENVSTTNINLEKQVEKSPNSKPATEFDNCDIIKSVSLKLDAEGLEIKEKDPIVTSSDNIDFSIDTEPMDMSGTSQPLPISTKRKREDEDIPESSKPQKLKLEQNDHIDSSEKVMAESSISKDETNIKLNNLSNQSIIDCVKFDPSSLLFCILKLRKAEDHILLDMNCPPEANRESMHQIFQFLKNKLTVSS